MNTSELRPIHECRDINHHAIRKVLPDKSYAILDKCPVVMNGNEHPADLHRWQNIVTKAGKEILEKAENEKRALTTDEEAAFDTCLRLHDYAGWALSLVQSNSSLSSEIDTNKRIFNSSQKVAPEHRPEELQGVTLGGVMKAMAMGAKGNFQIQNALSEGTNSGGGYTAPETIAKEFIDLARSKSVMNAAGARTLIVDSKKMSMAVLLNDPVSGWRAENASVDVSDAVFGTLAFVPQSLAVIVKCSRELMQDSINIEEILLNSLAKSMALAIDQACLYGTGANNQPLGLASILTTANRVTTLATNGSKLSVLGNYAPLVRALTKVELANDSPNAIILSPRTFGDLSVIVDTTGQPMQQPHAITDVKILQTSSIADTFTVGSATGLCSEAFVGAWSNLIIGMRAEINIEMLPQLYAANYQTAFLCSCRVDVGVARTNSFWMLKGILAE